MKLLKMLLLISLLIVPSVAIPNIDKKKTKEFYDFSTKGEDYKLLENLRFVDTEIEYVGIEKMDIFEDTYLMSKYSIKADVEVQTSCAIGPVNTETYKKVPTKFDVFIGDDKDRKIHNLLTQKIYNLWIKKEIYSGEFYFAFNFSDANYSFSVIPDTVNVKSFYFIWVNERIIKIHFKGFLEDSGFGVMDSFTYNNLRIHFNNTNYRAYEFPLRVQKQFFEFYKKGLFKM